MTRATTLEAGGGGENGKCLAFFRQGKREREIVLFSRTFYPKRDYSCLADQLEFPLFPLKLWHSLALFFDALLRCVKRENNSEEIN